MFGSLSDGEQKRVQIARSVMTDPELLLLDEPAASLDLGAREELVGLLGGYASSPASPAIVMVTHHVEEIPQGFTHALLLANGGIVRGGSARRGPHLADAQRHVRAHDRPRRDRRPVRRTRRLTCGRVGSARIVAGPWADVLSCPSRQVRIHHPSPKEVSMKTDIHPDYNAVVFRDLASGATFLTRSTVTATRRSSSTASPTR